MESQKEQALHPLLLPLCVLVCGGAMIGVFRLLGKLDDSVLYGAALGCGICILNLFLLRFTMNRAAAAAPNPIFSLAPPFPSGMAEPFRSVPRQIPIKAVPFSLTARLWCGRILR